MPKKPKSGTREKVASTVAPLAEDLLLELASRGAGRRPVEMRHVARLRKAALSCSKTACLSACDRIASQGIGFDDIADLYVPAVARTLGEDWVDDRISLASTSVGAAMLQWLLGALEQAHLHSDIAVDGPGVLLMVPAGEHHTLGAVLLGQQLRRRGFWVRPMLQARAESSQPPLQRRLNATMISASPATGMQDLRRLVTAARKATAEASPVLIGGTIADLEPGLADRSGADHVATDVQDALRFCQFEDRSGVSLV